MVAAIPDLWPQIKFDTLAPASILRKQVEYINSKGKGVVEAQLSYVTGDGDFVIIRLDLVAPLLEGQKYRVLIASHRLNLYPVQLEADCYRQKKQLTSTKSITDAAAAIFHESINLAVWPVNTVGKRIANDQEELIALVSEVLQSGEVRSAIESFIARTNELQQSTMQSSETDPQSVA
jgi:uncharacterized small protein (DUF1192 family)